MIYIDSNALIYLLHNAKPKSDIIIKTLVEHDELYTSLRTVEEASYILIRVNASKLYGAKGVYDVRRIVISHGLDFVKRELDALRDLLEENKIVVLQDVADIKEIHNAMAKHKLLPGDAIIALTCKHYGIDTILTFDKDFKRVPWLRVVP